MKPPAFITFTPLFLTITIFSQHEALPLENDRKLIVISMDGLMADEIQPDTMPFITEFYKNDGVFCPRLRPVFPTKTFVNHFSIATGMGSHILLILCQKTVNIFPRFFRSFRFIC